MWGNSYEGIPILYINSFQCIEKCTNLYILTFLSLLVLNITSSTAKECATLVPFCITGLLQWESLLWLLYGRELLQGKVIGCFSLLKCKLQYKTSMALLVAWNRLVGWATSVFFSERRIFPQKPHDLWILVLNLVWPSPPLHLLSYCLASAECTDPQSYL